MATVQEIMTQTPATISPAAPLRQAAQLMRTHNCRHLPVIDNDMLVGVITDRDIRLATNSPLINDELFYRKVLMDRNLVDDCMTQNPITVHPDMPLPEAAVLLKNHRFDALPVLQDRQLVGIVSTTDFLNYVIAIST